MRERSLCRGLPSSCESIAAPSSTWSWSSGPSGDGEHRLAILNHNIKDARRRPAVFRCRRCGLFRGAPGRRGARAVPRPGVSGRRGPLPSRLRGMCRRARGHCMRLRRAMRRCRRRRPPIFCHRGGRTRSRGPTRALCLACGVARRGSLRPRHAARARRYRAAP